MWNVSGLDPAHSDLLLVFTGKTTLNYFFLQITVNVLDNQPLAVDLFTKYCARVLGSDTDDAWMDDTVLNVWISCIRTGAWTRV